MAGLVFFKWDFIIKTSADKIAGDNTFSNFGTHGNTREYVQQNSEVVWL